MRLAPVSIPYRAVKRVSSLLVAVVFIGTAGSFETALAFGAAAVALAGALAYEVARYRRFEYELTEDTFDVRSGVISRRDREIPYRRIQNVDVSRSVLQRLLGIAAVDLETAGGSSTEGAIRYVTAERADWLRSEIQRRKRENETENGDSPASSGATEAAAGGVSADESETVLFELSSTELALVGALSFDARLIGLLAFLASGSVPVLSSMLPDLTAIAVTMAGLGVVAALFVGSWLLGAAIAISNYYGFTLSRAGDELRYDRGLFRQYSGSIPTGKVQTLHITDNPAKRLLDYATLTIETAGYAPGGGGDYGSQAAIPIARRDRVLDLAREIETFGDPEFERPPSRVRVRYAIRYLAVVAVLAAIAFGVDRYVAASLPWYGVAGLAVLAPIAAHYKWAHRGYWLGEDHLLTRSGFWRRGTRVVPYYRIQTVVDTRTVFQRRWNVATVVADTAGSGGFLGHEAAALDVETSDADRLRDELETRLQRSLSDRREEGGSLQTRGFEWANPPAEPGSEVDPGAEVASGDPIEGPDEHRKRDPGGSDELDDSDGTDR